MRKTALVLALTGLVVSPMPVLAKPAVDPEKRQCAVTYTALGYLVGMMGRERQDLNAEQRTAYGKVSSQFYRFAGDLMGISGDMPKDLTDAAGAVVADVMGDNDKAHKLMQAGIDCMDKYDQEIDLGILAG